MSPVVPSPGSRPPLAHEGLEVAASPRTAETKSAPAGEAPAAGAAASLWEVLTPEERVFYLQQQALGSLTYRPNGHPGGLINMPTGQRIDARG